MSGFWDPERAHGQAIVELQRAVAQLQREVAALKAADSESRDSPGSAPAEAGKA